MKLADNQELAQIEGMLGVGFVGFDLWRQMSELKRFAPRSTYFLRRFVLAAAFFACILHLVQLLIVIPARRTAIARTIDDITHSP